MTPDGRLRRTDGDSQNGAQGFLDDYSHLIDGLLALHAADGDLRWLTEAEKLTRQAVALFWDPLQSRFYDTGSDQENLIIRPRDVTDNALPSGHSMMTGVLIRLSIITGDGDLRTMASDSLRSVRDIMIQFPTGAGHWLSVLDFYLSDHKEAVIVTPPTTPSGKSAAAGPATVVPAPTVIPAKAGIHTPTEMLRRLASTFHTSAIVVSAPEDTAAASPWPVFQGRSRHRRQTHRLHLPKLHLPTPHHQPRHHDVPDPQLGCLDTYHHLHIENLFPLYGLRGWTNHESFVLSPKESFVLSLSKDDHKTIQRFTYSPCTHSMYISCVALTAHTTLDIRRTLRSGLLPTGKEP